MEQATGYSRYDAYKESGIDWIRSIPAHWDILKNKAIFIEKKEAGDDGLPILSVSLHTGVSEEEQTEEENIKSRRKIEDKSSYKRVEPGDIAFNMMRAWQGAIGVVRTKGMVSPAYIIAQPRPNVRSSYIEYLFRTPVYVEQMDRFSKGITDFRKRLYWDEFKQLHTLLPPIEEQERIADFLDKITFAIDQAIGKKQRLIELLNERKAILTNQVVTKGLNPDVSFREDGIKWILGTPKHWLAVRLKFLIKRLDQGWSPQCFNYPATDEQWGVLKVGCVNGYHFQPSENKTLPPELKPKKELQAKHDNVLISRANTLELVGSAAHLKNPRNKLIVCDKLYRVSIDQSAICPEYFVLIMQLRRAREQIEIGANGASPSMQNIGQDVIKNLWAAIPPKVEQEEIIKYLSEYEEEFKKASMMIKREIKVLEDFKASLISESVTGKIKV